MIKRLSTAAATPASLMPPTLLAALGPVAPSVEDALQAALDLPRRDSVAGRAGSLTEVAACDWPRPRRTTNRR